MHSLKLKLFFFLSHFLFTGNSVLAHEQIVLGYGEKKGNANTSIDRGEGMGVQINSKKKSIRHESVELDLIGQHPGTFKYYVCIFPFKGKEMLASIGSDRVFIEGIDQDKLSANLVEHEILLIGKYAVALEWAEKSQSG